MAQARERRPELFVEGLWLAGRRIELGTEGDCQEPGDGEVVQRTGRKVSYTGGGIVHER